MRSIRMLLLLTSLMTLMGLSAPRCSGGAPPGEPMEWSEEKTAAAAKWRGERLDLDVRIEPAEGRLSMDGEWVLRLEDDTSQGPVVYVNSRTAALAFESAEGPAGSDVSFNRIVREHPFARSALVTLPREAQRGDRVTLKFACRKHADSFQVIARKDIALASWVESWYPSPPADSANARSRQMSAPGRTRFHVPRDWDVVSNGKLIGRTVSEAGAIVEWEVDPAVARSFIAGPYQSFRHSLGGRDVGVYLLSEKPDAAREQAETLAKALAAMEERMGPYPYPSYAIAEVPKSAVKWYSSSEQGFIMARSDAFEYGPNLPLFAHEMAHGWWGNLVNQEGPGSILCSESLAQYCAVLAIEAIEGREKATEFLRFSRKGYSQRQCAKGYFEMLRDGKDAPLSQLDGQPFAHNLSDAKGHWVYHMLRTRVGDDVFFGVLRGLIRDFAGRGMSLDDVRRAFVAAAPKEAELERFFSDWLDRQGAPVIDSKWTATSDGAVEVVLTQAQKSAPYALDVEVAITGEQGETRHVVKLREQTARSRFTPSGKVTDVRIDPDHRLLIWDPTYGPRP